MKCFRRFAAIPVIFSILALLVSCTQNNEKSSSTQKRIFYEYFDTVGTFYDYSGLTEKDFSALADKVEDTLSEYHRLYDIYNE